MQCEKCICILFDCQAAVKHFVQTSFVTWTIARPIGNMLPIYCSTYNNDIKKPFQTILTKATRNTTSNWSPQLVVELLETFNWPCKTQALSYKLVKGWLTQITQAKAQPQTGLLCTCPTAELRWPMHNNLPRRLRCTSNTQMHKLRSWFSRCNAQIHSQPWLQSCLALSKVTVMLVSHDKTQTASNGLQNCWLNNKLSSTLAGVKDLIFFHLLPILTLVACIFLVCSWKMSQILFEWH